MSNGTCMSFGFSAEGMLGQGYGITHTMDPTEVFLPSEKGAEGNGIVSVSAGAFHAIAITENGQAYSWGINSDDRLGLGDVGDFARSVTTNPGDAKEDKVLVEWVPQKIDIASLSGNAASEQDDDSTYVVRACAGYDSSMLVARSGQVLSFGKRSGRLGKGEVASNVNVPKPMYGGLRLFHNRSSSGSNNSKPKGLHRRIQSERCLQDSAKAS
jgi:alpha-tubulin suppressor-like RCC1 family protein